MKKKFENYNSSIYLFLLLILIIIISTIYLQNHSYKTYYKELATLKNDNTVELVLNTEVLNKLNKERKISIEGKTYKVKIQKVLRNILKKEKKYYHQVTLMINLKEKEYKLLEIFTVMIYDEKKSLLTIFTSCLKGEQNAEVK